MNNHSRARKRPLFDVDRLTDFDNFTVRQREDGATTFRGDFIDEYGTARTKRRFVEAVLTDCGEWRARAGVKSVEPRAAWRAMNTAESRLHAVAFARHAVEHVRRRASAQIDSLCAVETEIERSI